MQKVGLHAPCDSKFINTFIPVLLKLTFGAQTKIYQSLYPPIKITFTHQKSECNSLHQNVMIMIIIMIIIVMVMIMGGGGCGNGNGNDNGNGTGNVDGNGNSNGNGKGG